MQTWSPFVPSRTRRLKSRSRLCRSFRQIAVRTEQWLTESRRSGLIPSETSITDLNLFELVSRHRRSIRVWRFRATQEAENGGDWEWTIGGQSEWLTMRVQAKKLNNDGRGYDYLGSTAPPRSGLPALQIDRLLQNAGGMPALYTFYNGEPDPTQPLQWRDACDPSPLLRGCTIASAAAVRKVVVPSGITPLADIAPLAVPWSDLVCCQWTEPLARRAQAAVERLGVGQAQLTAEPPSYFADLRGGAAGADLPGLAGLDGVVLIALEGLQLDMLESEESETEPAPPIHESQWQGRDPREGR